MEIATYGFAKLLRTQFAVSYSRDDTPVSLLNGFQLTWNYFAHSYTLAVIIGLLQIGGSILLLFRRTTLFGIVILLPITVNIVLINIFYNIAVGTFLNSILTTLGLSYLLLLRKSELMSVFWAPATDLPEVRLGSPTPLPGRPHILKNAPRSNCVPIPISTTTAGVMVFTINPIATICIGTASSTATLYHCNYSAFRLSTGLAVAARIAYYQQGPFPFLLTIIKL